MNHDVETRFYTQGITVQNKLEFLTERLYEICERIDDIAFDISKHEDLGRR